MTNVVGHLEQATIELITRQRHNNPESATLGPYQRRAAMRVALIKSAAAVGRAISKQQTDVADIVMEELNALKGATFQRITIYNFFTIAKCLKSACIKNYSININSSTNPIWSVDEMGTVVWTGQER